MLQRVLSAECSPVSVSALAAVGFGTAGAGTAVLGAVVVAPLTAAAVGLGEKQAPGISGSEVGDSGRDACSFQVGHLVDPGEA